jgi:hypothetical protein
MEYDSIIAMGPTDSQDGGKKEFIQNFLLEDLLETVPLDDGN